MNDEIIMILIAEIHVLNPRHRDQKKFEVIVNSIKTLGLKMPITVSMRAETEPAGPKYDLVCGQGRMEAFIALGYLEIPAIVVEITKEERLIRSLVENIARRYPSPMDLIREIERLRAEGYNNHQISGKLDVSDTTVSGLPSLPMPTGCLPEKVDALLCPGGRDGYPSRLFFSERIQTTKPLNWNAVNFRIAERNWHAFSWRIAGNNLRLAQMILTHLSAFQCN